ncbi:hypothetical protein JNW90_24265 [Micromonospora sp. STR1s_5]|nr:hypothetical protein [Micromonospora sp. STR1s_5]
MARRIEHDAEQVLRQASVEVELPVLARELLNHGWAVNVTPELGRPARQLRASKDGGRVWYPGGHRGQWDPVVTRVRVEWPEQASGEPVERTEWQATLSLSTPVDVVLALAMLAAHDPDDLQLAS